MKLDDVKKRAKKFNVDIADKSKKDLILAVQVAEGSFPCFGSATVYCDQFGCCWRDDCLRR